MRLDLGTRTVVEEAAPVDATGLNAAPPLTPPLAREAISGVTAATPADDPDCRPRAGRGDGIPPSEERRALELNLGGTLRSLRAEAAMTQRLLGRRSGVSKSMVSDLERGMRRPSPATLGALAVGLTRRLPPVAPVVAGPVLERLVTAAGSSLVVDTSGGRRRRERRLRDALNVYRRDVDDWWRGEVAAAQQAELNFVAAIDILDLPGALDDAEMLGQAIRHMDAHRAWMLARRPGPWGTTSAFRAMASRHGFSVARRRAS